MADRKKRVQDGNTKIWISREQKELSGADAERLCEFSMFQCEKMSATMVLEELK